MRPLVLLFVAALGEEWGFTAHEAAHVQQPELERPPRVLRELVTWARGAGAPSGGAAALARTATQEEEERSLSGLQLALAVIEQVLLEPGWEPAPTGAPFGLLEPLELVTLLGAAVRLAGSAEEEPGAIARTHARTVISAVRL